MLLADEALAKAARAEVYRSSSLTRNDDVDFTMPRGEYGRRQIADDQRKVSTTRIVLIAR